MTHLPGYFWTHTRCLPFPLPAYTWIAKDGALWVSVPAQQVAAAHVALFVAGVALVDAWRDQRPRGVIVGDLRQLGLFERVA